MADIATITKKIGAPERIMGGKSTSNSGPVLYYEYGTFIIANAATSGTLPTDLTNVVAMVLTPMNAYANTASPYSDLVVANGAITLTNTDPGNAAGGAFAYMLFGTTDAQ